MGGSQSKAQRLAYPFLDERHNDNTRSKRISFGLLRGHKTQCEGESDAPPLPPPPPTANGKSQPPPPPPDAAATSGDDSIAQAARSASAFTNPGPYEMVAQESKRIVSLDTYDGFRCDISKQLSPYMVAIHNFWLGTTMMQDGRKSTYAFVCQVADESGLLMARVDPGRGSVDGRVHSVVFGGIPVKLQLGLSTEGQQDQAIAEIDLGGETWAGNVKYGSMGGGIAYGCNFFQAVTPRLAMGGEGMYLGVNNTLMSNYTLRYTLPAKTGEEDLPSSLASAAETSNGGGGGPPAENTGGSSTLWASFNTMSSQASLCYRRVVTPNRVTLGASLDFSPFTLESQMLFGAEFKLNKSKLNFCVDGTCHIQSTLETKLGMGQGAPSLCFSADVDHSKDEMRFGYGLNFEG